MINLPELAARLEAAKLLNKSFLECTREEILQLCEILFSCPNSEEVPASGWAKPLLYQTEDGRRGLSIPLAVHPKYRWWTPKGQSLEETLIELEAPFDIAQQHIPHLTEEAWKSKLVPFDC